MANFTIVMHIKRLCPLPIKIKCTSVADPGFDLGGGGGWWWLYWPYFYQCTNYAVYLMTSSNLLARSQTPLK